MLGRFWCGFKIFGETTASFEPGERSFHDPSSGNDLEADCYIGSFNDFSFQMGYGFLLRLFEDRPSVSAIGEEFSLETETCRTKFQGPEYRHRGPGYWPDGR